MPITAILIFLTSSFFFWTSLYVYVPILAPYADHLGGSMTVVGLVVASYGLMQLLFRIPLGVWSDRTGRRKAFIAAGLMILAASALGLAVSPSPEWMILARALGGVAACVWVIWSVMYAGYFPADRATAAMSHMVACSALGQMVSMYAGGWIAEVYGWQAPFYAGAVLAGVSLLCLLPVPETKTAPSERLSFDRVKAIGTTRTLLIISSIAAVGQFVNFVTIYGFTPLYAVEIGASSVQLGALMLVGMLFQMVASFLSGVWLAPRFGNGPTVISGFGIMGFGTAMIPYTDTMLALYTAQAVGGIGRGLIQPILMGLTVQAVPDDERGAAMGVFQAVYAIGMFGGPALGGVIGNWIGLTGVFVSTAAICAVTAGIMMYGGIGVWAYRREGRVEGWKGGRMEE